MPKPSLENKPGAEPQSPEKHFSDDSTDSATSAAVRSRPASLKQDALSPAPDSEDANAPESSQARKATNPEAIRHSISAGRKKIMSMFNAKLSDAPSGSPPPPRPAKPPRRGVEISGPVVSKSDAAMLPKCDSYIPIQNEGAAPVSKKDENPYCELYSDDEFSEGSHDPDAEPEVPDKARLCRGSGACRQRWGLVPNTLRVACRLSSFRVILSFPWSISFSLQGLGSRSGRFSSSK